MKDRGLLTNRDYVLLWSGSAISGLGSQLSVLAYPLLVLSLSGSAAEAGAVGTCSLVSRLVFRFPGGHVTDLLSWRKLMICMDVIRLIALVSIPLAAAGAALTYPQLLAVATVEGTATAFFQPASSVALRDIVPAERLTAAFGMSQSRMAAISLAGPVLGGALFAASHTLPFATDAGTYAVSAALITALCTRPVPRAADSEHRDRRVTAGLRWLAKQREVMIVLFFGTVINLVGAAAETAVIIVLRDGGTASSIIGAVMACAGIGAIAGAALSPAILRFLRSRPLCLVTGIIWACGLAAFALKPVPALIAPLLVVLILVTPALGVRLGELTVGQAPRELLGRISTAEQTVTAGLASVGPLLAGAAVQDLGGTRTFVVLAVLCAVSAAIAALPVRRDATKLADGGLRLDPQVVPEQQAESGKA